jgi:hypothetical protein
MKAIWTVWTWVALLVALCVVELVIGNSMGYTAVWFMGVATGVLAMGWLHAVVSVCRTLQPKQKENEE